MSSCPDGTVSLKQTCVSVSGTATATHYLFIYLFICDVADVFGS